MSCFWGHSWEVVSKRLGSITIGSCLFKDSQEDAIAVHERCQKCGKDRHYVKTISGSVHHVDADWFE